MKSKEFVFGATLTVFTILVTTCLIEATLRVKHHKYGFKNFVEENWNLASWEFPIQHDPKLGWIPKEYFTNKAQNEKSTLNILSKGIRSNGENSINFIQKIEPILAVGASTVFGSQVSDHETWPALLESELKIPVLNGGVFAYGFDQVILRLEQLLPERHPSQVILGIHPDNLNQVTMSQKYGKKPYFEVADNKLVLRNTPVPPTKKELAPYQAILGYSYLSHYILSKLSPQFWLDSHGEIKAHNQEKEVTCLLVERYDELCKSNQLKCSILFQYFQTTAPEARERVLALNSCLKDTSLLVLDTYESLEELKVNSPKLYESFFDFHMTPKGNAWVANYIKEKIKSGKETTTSHL
jgi:hypothetical protein